MKYFLIVMAFFILPPVQANEAENCAEKSGYFPVSYNSIEVEIPSFLVSKGEDVEYGAEMSYSGPWKKFFYPVCDLGMVDLKIGKKNLLLSSDFGLREFNNYVLVDYGDVGYPDLGSSGIYFYKKPYGDLSVKSAVVFFDDVFIFISTIDDDLWSYFGGLLSKISLNKSGDNSEESIRYRLNKLRKLHERYSSNID